MRKLSLLFAAAALSLSITPAFADGVTITVTPWLAPNAYGSPSWPAAVANSISAQMNHVSSYGAAGPSQFNAVTGPVTASSTIVTGFTSWMGVANPASPYQNELGNRMSFAVAIVGNGTQFSISQVSFSGTTNTVGSSALDFAGAPGFFSYSDDYEGVVYNIDGSIKTIYNSSNPTANTTLVDAVFGRGRGNSYDAYCNSCTTDQEQAAITAAAAQAGGPYAFTGTYTLGSVSGSGTFNVVPDAISATPEPSSLVLLGTGVLGLAGAARRRFSSK